MNIAVRDEIFGTLCELSDRQCDPHVKDRLKTFIGRSNDDVKDELLGLIDDCVYAAWTSNFDDSRMLGSIIIELMAVPVYNSDYSRSSAARTLVLYARCRGFDSHREHCSIPGCVRQTLRRGYRVPQVFIFPQDFGNRRIAG